MRVSELILYISSTWIAYYILTRNSLVFFWAEFTNKDWGDWVGSTYDGSLEWWFTRLSKLFGKNGKPNYWQGDLWLLVLRIPEFPNLGHGSYGSVCMKWIYAVSAHCWESVKSVEEKVRKTWLLVLHLSLYFTQVARKMIKWNRKTRRKFTQQRLSHWKRDSFITIILL